MVNNATDLELKEHNDNAQFASELNSKQEPVNQNSANASTLDCSSTPEISASQITDTSIFETNSEIQNNSSVENSLEAENNNVNCLALTVKKTIIISFAVLHPSRFSSSVSSRLGECGEPIAQYLSITFPLSLCYSNYLSVYQFNHIAINIFFIKQTIFIVWIHPPTIITA